MDKEKKKEIEEEIFVAGVKVLFGVRLNIIKRLIGGYENEEEFFTSELGIDEIIDRLEEIVQELKLINSIYEDG